MYLWYCDINNRRNYNQLGIEQKANNMIISHAETHKFKSPNEK